MCYYFFAILAMTQPVKFLKETYNELTQVVWPTKNEVIRLTGVVITLSILMGLYIGGLDWVFTRLMELVLK
jgi:preprotein translocase subunit SecE